MNTDDTRAARRIVNLWLDGIGIHIAAAEIERLHTIAAGVIAQERRRATGPTFDQGGALPSALVTETNTTGQDERVIRP